MFISKINASQLGRSLEGRGEAQHCHKDEDHGGAKRVLFA